ncbi:AMP-binding protein [Salana multivorans]
MSGETPNAAPPDQLDHALAGRALLRLGAAADLDLPVVPGAALYCATSGSTGGAPRIVALSATILRHAVAATHERLGGAGAWLLSLPADHIAGFMVQARARADRQPLVLSSPGRFSAETFVSDVDRLRAATAARRYGSLVPTQLRRVLDDDDATAAAATLDAILVGGAATPPQLLARARAAGVAVVTTYGMTETAGGCVYDGVPLHGTRVELVDETGRPAPVGRIHLLGEQVALGYVTQQGLEPFFGVVVTNDRGRWVDGEGRLEVLGRLDDVLLSGGVNVDPHAVERVALEVAGVAEAVVVGVPDPEWGQAVCLALTTADGHDPAVVVDDVQAAVRARLGAASAPKRVLVRADSLPLRGPGKIDRRAIAEAFAAGAGRAAPPRED